jgi:flagellar assembly protein FliH
MSETAHERWQPRTLTSVPTSRKSLEEVAESARQEGYQAGFAKGEEDAKREGSQKTEQLAALWSSMEKPMADQDAEVSEYLLSLVLALVKSVLRRELTTDASLIKDTLDRALKLLAEGRAPLEVRLNPADKSVVEAHLDEKRLTAELISDNAVLRGGCSLSRGQAVVDASIEQQLRTLIEELVANDMSAGDEGQEKSPLDPDQISAIAERFAKGSDDDG